MEKVVNITENGVVIRKPRKQRVWLIMLPLIVALMLLALLIIRNISNAPEPARTTHRQHKISPSKIEISGDQDKSSTEVSNYLRLPTTLIPRQYNLSIVPFLEEYMNFTMAGSVRITVQCVEATNVIVLHAKNLTINERSVTLRDPTNLAPAIQVIGHSYDQERDFYRISLSEPMRQYTFYELSIEFIALISDDMTGFYKSSYVDKSTNETRWLGVTQFEPTYARRAFPCFDEPALKAEFQISIARKDNMTSISNMNLQRTEQFEQMAGWSWDHYDNSFPMSTYLVAFVVSDLKNQESTFTTMKGETKQFRVWARGDMIHHADYALKIGPKLIMFFETYFNIDFPLPKMDMIAVPDFDSGAMENWGLIVYKEVEMLYDPGSTSKAALNRVASTISHELSHQWFGNLVTMSWWSDLWLNEGFATYFEYVGVNHVEPTWNKMQLMLNNDIEDVMQVDVLDSAHPISKDVEDPDQINEIFDAITYSKGSSVIGMLNNFISPEAFRQGLRSYLLQWKYYNTVPADLWQSFTDAAHDCKTLPVGLSVHQIMNSWTSQQGFPVVTVTRNYDTQTAVFAQTRFRLRPKKASDEPHDDGHLKWWIPISYACPQYNTDFQSTQPQFWISDDTSSVDKWIPAAPDEFFIANINQTGFYRVNYDMQNWQLIASQLTKDPSKISLLNRAQILDDALNLARSSQLPYEFVFSLTFYLRRHEKELSPWQSFLDGMSHILNMLDDTPAYSLLQKFMLQIIAVQYNEITFKTNLGSTLQEDMHDLEIVSWACVSQNEDCIKRTRQFFEDWVAETNPDKNNPVPVNIRKPMYCSMAENGNETEWNFLWARYLATDIPAEKKTLLRALACTKNLTILQRLIEMAVTDDSGIRKQDGISVLKEVAFNPVGTALVFELLNKKWTSIQTYLSSVDVVFDAIGGQFYTQRHLTSLKIFKSKYESELGSNQISVEEAMEKVSANIAWMQDHYEEVVALLKKYIDLSMD